MRTSISSCAAVVFFAGIVAGSGYSLQARADEATPAPIVVENPYVKPVKPLLGAVRPDFGLPDVNGVVRHVSEWDGKVLVLNFWATWCRPCLTEIPEFIELQRKYNDRGLQFVGIALHAVDEVRQYITDAGMNYPVLAGMDEVRDVAKSFGNRFIALPYTVMIDRDRRIYYIRSGPLKYEEADALIRSML